MIFRMIQFLLGCGHYAVTRPPYRVPLMGMSQCQRRVYHKGPHLYEGGWKEAW